jgi:hypothetical protein
MFEDKGFRLNCSICDVNRGVAEWLTGGDGMCQWKRLSSEGLQANIHSSRTAGEWIATGDDHNLCMEF